MSDLKFNIYAFVKPQTPEEYVALLHEMILQQELFDDDCKQVEQLIKDSFKKKD